MHFFIAVNVEMKTTWNSSQLSTTNLQRQRNHKCLSMMGYVLPADLTRAAKEKELGLQKTLDVSKKFHETESFEPHRKASH